MTISDQDHTLIERYLDEALPEGDRAAFQTRIDAERALQEQLALAEQLAASLCRSFTVPEIEASVTDQQAPPRFRFGRPLGLTLAAAAALLAIGVAIKINLPPPPRIYLSLLERTYSVYEMNDFTPEWVCGNDEEFAAAVRDRLGQPMLVDISDSQVELLGWAYGDDMTGYGDTVISEDSMILLTRVEGQGVVVIVDRVEDDTNPLEVGDHLGLASFRRVLGDLVLYEVTPRASSGVLDRVYTPADSGDAQSTPEGDGEGG